MHKIERLYLGTILIAYLVLSFSYALEPLFEPPDEALHYEYVRELADTRQFPDPYSRLWTQFLQPPAYYLMLTPILMLIPDHDFTPKYGENLLSPIRGKTASTDDDDPGEWVNPYFGQDSAYSTQNKNLLLHEQNESFPFNGNRTAFATFVLRLVSIVLGGVTIGFSYRIFRMLWPGQLYRHVLAVSIVAFWPLFHYMAGAVNNDNLVFMLSTIALYLILRQQKTGMTPQDAILLGVVFGLSILTKWHMIILAVPMGIAVVTDRRTWRFVPLILLLTLAVGGWWYLRNYILFGSFTLFDHPQVNASSVTGDNQFDFEHAVETFPRIFDAFWVRFNIITVSEELYTAFKILMTLAAAGLVIRAIRFALNVAGRKLNDQWLVLRQGLVLLAFITVWFAVVFYVSGVLDYGYQGRYTLGALAALSALMTLGWTAFIPSRLERPLSLSASSGLFAVAVIVLAGYFRPAFSPLPVSRTIEHVLNYRYEDTAKLLGTDKPVVEGQPGDTVEITLSWEAISPAESRHVVVYIGAEGDGRISQHSYPAGGNLLASDWTTGQQWSEHHFLEISSDVESQRIYPLTAGLYDVPSAHTFTAYDSAGNQVFPTIGQLIVHGRPDSNPDYVHRFGDSIGLQEPVVRRDGSQIQLCLTWVSLQRVETDYHYFVHVVENDELISQVDGQPWQGDYPTSAWLPGEVIDDCVPVDIDSTSGADQQINIGLYELETFQRLPITQRGDNATTGDFISVDIPARD